MRRKVICKYCKEEIKNNESSGYNTKERKSYHVGCLNKDNKALPKL